MQRSSRDALVDAARAMLQEQSPSSITGRAIAEGAGVTYGLLSYYWRTKDQVIVEAIDQLREDRRALVPELVTFSLEQLLTHDVTDPYMIAMTHVFADDLWWADHILPDDDVRLFHSVYTGLGYEGRPARAAASILHAGWVLVARMRQGVFSPGHGDYAETLALVVVGLEAIRQAALG